jgi:subtilisin family serine protease
VHPDTGYTDHPELRQGANYEYARARNHLDTRKDARDTLDFNNPLGWHPSHGVQTASVLMSAEGHPNLSPSSYPEPADRFVSGVAPGATLIPSLVTIDFVYLLDWNTSALAKAIWYATSQDDVGVISISLGRLTLPYEEKWGTSMISLDKALRHARNEGIVVCAAAGQAFTFLDSWIGPIFPGNHPDTICVAACDSENNKPLWGFYGPEVDISAPGVDIWIATSKRTRQDPQERHIIQNNGEGSSYATAIVAGACALWQAHHGRANLIQRYGKGRIFEIFKTALQESCHTPANWDVDRGKGVLDADALLKMPLPQPPSSP